MPCSTLSCVLYSALLHDGCVNLKLYQHVNLRVFFLLAPLSKILSIKYLQSSTETEQRVLLKKFSIAALWLQHVTLWYLSTYIQDQFLSPESAGWRGLVLALQRVMWLLAVIPHKHCGLLKVVLGGRHSMAMVSEGVWGLAGPGPWAHHTFDNSINAFSH